jgi:hypothetical protein
MRQHHHSTPGARASQRVWLKLVQTLLQLGVLLGGALGPPQAVASAAVTALQDAQQRGELTIARDGSRAALVNPADKRLPDSSPPPKHPAAAPALPLAQSQSPARTRPVGFAARLRSKHRTQPFQARAPPRKP